tara:strand:+ start:551 stop:781 length:231 start_codon:yes stop_codon:yes gene_type:complete
LAIALFAVALVHLPLLTLAAASFSKRFTRSDLVVIRDELAFRRTVVFLLVRVAFFFARRFGLGFDELSEGYSDAVV